MLSELVIRSRRNFIWGSSVRRFMIIPFSIAFGSIDCEFLCLLPWQSDRIFLEFRGWLLRNQTHQFHPASLQIPNSFIHKIKIVEVINFFNSFFNLVYGYKIRWISKPTFFGCYKYLLTIFHF